MSAQNIPQPVIVTFPEPNKNFNIANGVRNVFHEWQVMLLRLTLFALALICSFCITFLLLKAIAKNSHPVFQQRADFLETPKFIFLTGSDLNFNKEQFLILTKIIDTFPDYVIELFLLKNETEPKSPKPIIKSLLEILATRTLSDDSIENMLIYYQLKNDNFHVHRVDFHQFFRFTQMEANWTKYSISQLLLGARILLIWQQSGISFDLQNIQRNSLYEVFNFIENVSENTQLSPYFLTNTTVDGNIVPTTQQFDEKFLFLASKLQCNLYFENLFDNIFNVIK